MKKIFAFALFTLSVSPVIADQEKPFNIETDLPSHVTAAACTNSELALLATGILGARAAAVNDLAARRAELALSAASTMNPRIASVWGKELPGVKLIEDAYLSDRVQYEVTCKSPYLNRAQAHMTARYKEELEKLTVAEALVLRVKDLAGS